MIVVSQLDQLALDGPVLLTVGTFDGVHRGHRFLLEQAQRRAEEHGYHFLIVTFDPPPAIVLRPSLGRYQLTEAAEKVRLLGELAPAAIVVLPFTHELAQMPADQFMAAIERRVQLREMWLGEDFHFGRGREGGLTMLVERGREYGFALHVVARRMEHARSISSSRIRKALADGEVGDAIPLLGRPFSLAVADAVPSFPGEGTIVPSRVRVAPQLVLPADGSYACLLSSEGVGDAAVAALVRREEAWQVVVLAENPLPGTARLEFIERLPDGAHNAPAALALARGRLVRWVRPVYPAAGDY